MMQWFILVVIKYLFPIYIWLLSGYNEYGAKTHDEIYSRPIVYNLGITNPTPLTEISSSRFRKD
jgi:hypothetical protein